MPQTDQTLDEPGYKQVGGNGDQGVDWFNESISDATRLVRHEDIGGSVLRTVDMVEAEFISHDLRRDDIGWQQMTGASNLDMSESLRVSIVRRARQYARHDGNVRQINALYTNFCIGKGFTWSVGEEADAAQTILDALTKSAANRNVFSTQGQRNRSDALRTDGEVFFALFAGINEIKVRTIDPLEIIAIATNAEDKSEPRVYVRKYYVGSAEKAKLYKDWMWSGEGDAVDAQGKVLPNDYEDAVIFHVKLAGRGLRGESGLIADMDWAKQYREFMTSRAAVTRAIAMFAHKLKMQGDAATLAAAKTQLGTGLSESSSETNPPPVAGSTFLENLNASLSSMKQETGAASAKVDAELFMQQVAVGSGIFPHYLGLGNSFRLATATSMEPPMFKAFSAYQELWRDTYMLIFDWAMEQMGVPDDDREVTVTGEKIREQDIAPIIDGIEKMVRTFPSLAASEDVAKHALSLLGFTNPAEVMTQLAEAFKNIPGHNVAALVHAFLREAVKQGGAQTQQEG